MSAGGIRIAPSILSADFAALGRDIAAIERGGADLIHVDVMDGHFVPNITMGPMVVQAVKRVATRPLDVHLMIEQPDNYIEAFVKAGAHMISVHVEAAPHLHRTLSYIRSLGALAGAVINPSTPASALEAIAGDLDFVVVMSVNPGFGGQKFIPQSLDKIRRVRAVLAAAGSTAPIEIDGGVDASNIEAIAAAGASIFVAGNAIFGTPDPEAATRALRARAEQAVRAEGMSSRAEAQEAKAGVRRARVRVRYADTDQMGVTYHANYLVWFEVGRTDWLRESGWTYRDMEEAGVALPVIEVFCQYHQPARYDDELEVRTRATLLTPVRIRFDYEVVRVADGTASASGHSVHAALNPAGRPCRLPERVLEMLDRPAGQAEVPTVYN